MAAASADGVVLSSVEDDQENHPTAKAAPLLRKEGSLVYRVIGQPEDLGGAKELADKDKYGFQYWILPLIGAKSFGSEAGKKEGKKGADGGIDGMIEKRNRARPSSRQNINGARVSGRQNDGSCRRQSRLRYSISKPHGRASPTALPKGKPKT